MRRSRLVGVAIAGIIGATTALGGFVFGFLAVGLPILPVLAVHAWFFAPRVLAELRRRTWRPVVAMAVSVTVWTVVLVALAGLVAGTAAGIAPGVAPVEAALDLVIGGVAFGVATVLPVVAVQVIVWVESLRRAT